MKSQNKLISPRDEESKWIHFDFYLRDSNKFKAISQDLTKTQLKVLATMCLSVWKSVLVHGKMEIYGQFSRNSEWSEYK